MTMLSNARNESFPAWPIVLIVVRQLITGLSVRRPLYGSRQFGANRE